MINIEKQIEDFRKTLKPDENLKQFTSYFKNKITNHRQQEIFLLMKKLLKKLNHHTQKR